MLLFVFLLFNNIFFSIYVVIVFFFNLGVGVAELRRSEVTEGERVFSSAPGGKENYRLLLTTKL